MAVISEPVDGHSVHHHNLTLPASWKHQNNYHTNPQWTCGSLVSLNGYEVQPFGKNIGRRLELDILIYNKIKKKRELGSSSIH